MRRLLLAASLFLATAPAALLANPAAPRLAPGQKPVFASALPSPSLTQGTRGALRLPAATDVDGLPVSYALTGLPPGMAFYPNRVALGAPTAAGTFKATYTASSANGATRGTVTFTVAPPATRPLPIGPGSNDPFTTITTPAQDLTVNQCVPVTFEGYKEGPGTATWDFGDGTPTVSGMLPLAHAFSSPGVYTVTFSTAASGNYDAGQDQRTITVVAGLPDTQAPGVTARPGVLSVANRSRNLEADAQDNVGVTKVEFYVNDNLMNVQTLPVTGSTYMYGLTMSSMPPAAAVPFKAKAYDCAGNVNESNTTFIVPDFWAPTVGTPTVSGTTGTAVSGWGGTLTFTVTASDNGTLGKVTFYVDGNEATRREVAGHGNGTYTATFDSMQLVNGDHNLHIVAEDVQTEPTMPPNYWTTNYSRFKVTNAVTVSVTPTTTTLAPGQTQAFSATVSGATNTAVTWTVSEGAAGGTVTTGGLYTAPATNGTYHVVATSVADPTKSATATVTVSSSVVTIAISPGTANLPVNQTMSFTAAVGNTANKAVTWTATSGTLGTPVVDGSGSTVPFTAPGAATTVTLTATSQADPTKSAQAAVTITADPVAITVSPSTIALAPGEPKAFSATVSGTANTAVSWHASGGSPVDSTANPLTWTAPTSLGTYTLVATAMASPTKTATATITVGTPSVSVSPATITLAANASTTFTATVTGASNQAVTWSVVEAGGGSVTSGGVYTTPASAGTYHVKATAVVDPTKSAQATITVTAPTTPTLIWKRTSVYAFGTLVSEDTPLEGTIYVQGDQVGSPNLISNAAGQLKGRSKNLPFGERFGSTGVKSSRRYTNHEDQSGSAIYMQARMYLPAYGKFAQVDPAYDQTKDDPESWNLYGYCTNNPVTKTDPDGRAIVLMGTGSDGTRFSTEATEDQLSELLDNGSVTINGMTYSLPQGGGTSSSQTPTQAQSPGTNTAASQTASTNNGTTTVGKTVVTGGLPTPVYLTNTSANADKTPYQKPDEAAIAAYQELKALNPNRTQDEYYTWIYYKTVNNKREYYYTKWQITQPMGNDGLGNVAYYAVNDIPKGGQEYSHQHSHPTQRGDIFPKPSGRDLKTAAKIKDNDVITYKYLIGPNWEHKRYKPRGSVISVRRQDTIGYFLEDVQ